MYEIIDAMIEEQTETRYTTEDIYGNHVILYNDDYNTFDHVEDCLRKICFKSSAEAQKIALQAHTKGHAPCYKGSLEECETVVAKMEEEGLTVSLN